ncbi:MAG: ABC transporter permease [Desulfovibrio sp.]|nr:ABC transporter permease [Desulfovibrio sp.]
MTWLSKLLSLCYQDLQERFAGSLLGTLWVFIWPLIQLFIYMVIFGKLMGGRLGMHGQIYSYGFYIASGLLSWTFFATSVARCSRCLIDKSGIIRKVKVNLPLFPAVVCATELMPFCAGLILLVLADLFTGWLPSPAKMALLALAIYTQLILAFGFGSFLACATVFIRDTSEITGVCLQMAFWFTPIVYLPTILPDWLAGFLWINPMTDITSIFQHCFVSTPLPGLFAVIYALVVAHCVLVLGCWTMHGWRKDILDVL